MTLIGIDQDDLLRLVEEATRKGYEMARKDIEESEWLHSRHEICSFLSPDKPISPATFNRNRAKGVYGESIIGQGINCKARKEDLLSAIHRYQLQQL